MLKYWNHSTFDVTNFKWNLEKRKNQTHKTSGSDNTGNITYTYNTLGFRGDKYPFQGQKKVLLAVGCSFTEGVGVNDNETWPFFLANLLNYNHINLGFTGRSNDYIARVLLTYFDIIKPDYIHILYTDTHRREYYPPEGGIEPYHHNSWGWFTENTLEHTALTLLSNKNENFINWYKNHLLITYFLKTKNVKWRWDSTFIETDYTDENKFNGSIKPFLDLSADTNHPGPLTNHAYAVSIFEKLKHSLL